MTPEQIKKEIARLQAANHDALWYVVHATTDADRAATVARITERAHWIECLQWVTGQHSYQPSGQP